MIKTPAILYNGKMYVGPDHDRIHDKIENYDPEVPKVEGFLTDSGSFLNRTQAAQHAQRCNQVGKEVEVLFSYHL